MIVFVLAQENSIRLISFRVYVFFYVILCAPLYQKENIFALLLKNYIAKPKGCKGMFFFMKRM